MTNPPPYPDSNDDTSTVLDRGAPPSTPRWVKVFGIIFIVLVLLFVILHITGNGFRGLHGYVPPSSGIASVAAYGMQWL